MEPSNNNIESSVVKREIELHQQLKNLDCIGFDMDMTIVRYRNQNFSELVYSCLLEHLGPLFPHLNNSKFDIDQCHRGVLLDITTGYMLKLDSEKHVLKAFLGDTEISKERINEIYHAETIPENRPLAEFTGSNSSRFLVLNSFFELPLTPLWICHMNHLVRVANKPDLSFDHSELMRFLKEAIVSFNHSFGDFYHSRYFREIRNNPGHFVHKATPECIKWLRDLKSRGTRVLLITNSKSEYTHLLMTYAYGADFQQLFELIITDSKKPDFFRKKSPIYDLGDYHPKEITDSMKVDTVEFNKPTVYHQGNVEIIIDLVRATTKKEDISFCYVGDHLIGDVSVPKQHCKWMTIAIVEEVEDENEIVVLQKKKSGFQSKGIGKQYEWGSFFCVEHNHEGAIVPKETFWSSVIRYNSDIAISSVETLAKYFNDDKFDKESLKPCSIVYN